MTMRNAKILSVFLALRRGLLSSVRRDESGDDLKFVEVKDLANPTSPAVLTESSHAMTHRDLATLNYGDQVYELEQSAALFLKQRQHIPTALWPQQKSK